MTAFRDYGRTRFTPRERESASDPSIRTAQHTTVDIALADGDVYNLNGFVQGTWQLVWDDGASYANFQTYIDSSDDPAVKVQDVSVTASDTVTATQVTEGEGVSVAGTPVTDTVHFYVDSDGSLVLANGNGTGGNARVFELARLT
jgi:hypothetical protein